MLRVPHEVIILTRRAWIAAEVIVAPVAVVVTDGRLVVLLEELQVVVDPPFGVLAGALDDVPLVVRGSWTSRPVRRSASSSMLTPGCRSRRLRKGCSLQGGPLCDEPQRQRCGMLVLSLDALSG